MRAVSKGLNQLDGNQTNRKTHHSMLNCAAEAQLLYAGIETTRLPFVATGKFRNAHSERLIYIHLVLTPHALSPDMRLAQNTWNFFDNSLYFTLLYVANVILKMDYDNNGVFRILV